MIELNNIKIIKDDKVIFSNLSFTFKKGHSYAVMGPSGSGKSTLLNVIAGFEKIDAGSFYIDTINFKKINSINFYRYTLGYMFQNYGLIDNLSISKNLDIALEFNKLSSKQKEIKKVDALNEVNISLPISRKISSLSGGEQQRVALARLLLKKPKIILADEPTGSLDKANGEVIINKLLNLTTDDTILILATHDIEIAKRCNEIINIQDLKGTSVN